MNALAHRTTAAAVLSAISFAEGHSFEPNRRLGFAMAGGTAGYALGLLPDLLEPATSPNHRQFFHSILFGAAIVGVGHKLYQWQPESDGDKILRWLGLAASAAYLVHLALDATTKKSLPLIGQ
jgi:inner membrane protein